MARRHNPLRTLLLFVAVLGFGAAAYHYLWVERVFDHEEVVVIPQEQIDDLRKTVHEGLTTEESYVSIASFNWRGQTKRYRVDVTLVETADVRDAKRMAGKVSSLVQRASEGYPAEVSFLVLGREIYHYVP
jgi:hypothetical protein